MMRKKWLPHVIVAVSLAVFIVLGLASDAETLPPALDSDTPGTSGTREQQEIRREFNTAGSHTFVFSEAFPATIEIYALGAGGGGQGGHSKVYQQGLGTRTETGRGAGGGGGGAFYTRVRVDSPVTLNINVGAGGAAGAGHHKGLGGSWESGRPGTAGGNTTVTMGSISVTANGGRGGAAPGDQNLTGGLGGSSGATPQNVLNWEVSAGGAGADGQHNSREGGTGGSSAQIRDKGSVNNFNGISISRGTGGGGGLGNNAGTEGAPGYVLVIVRY